MSKPTLFKEHYSGTLAIADFTLPEEMSVYFFPKKRGNEDNPCFSVFREEEQYKIKLSYFIGVDWIRKYSDSIYVEPKLNGENCQTDYLKMLFSALKHPEISGFTDELFEIRFDEPFIRIEQNQDLLTPLLIIRFISIVKEIVRKGLKKSYYKTQENLYSRVRGKVLVASTIKQNMLKGRMLHTYCKYDEFGIDGFENRLLKKALRFIQRFLSVNTEGLAKHKFITDSFNFILPAFETVSVEVDLKDIINLKVNAFYKEYEEGIRLARIILKRYGYNIKNAEQNVYVQTPPFWIDMSKLFELYVLGLLKERFKVPGEVKYHFTKQRNELDYLIHAGNIRVVGDAKYKKSVYDKNDIRQLSGYARITAVAEELNIPPDQTIDCLIFYPDQSNGVDDLLNTELLHERNAIRKFTKFYKIGVRLPIIK